MCRKSLTAIAVASLTLPALLFAADMDTGSVPATKSQMETLENVPDSVTDGQPEAGGMMSNEMPMSPHQGQVTGELDDRFDSLDMDRDGQISRAEGENDPALRSRWSELDSNSDDQLDRAEFSAFETPAQ